MTAQAIATDAVCDLWACLATMTPDEAKVLLTDKDQMVAVLLNMAKQFAAEKAAPMPTLDTGERITVTPIPEHWYTPVIRYEALLSEIELLIGLQFESSDNKVINNEFATKLHGMILGFRCGTGNPDVGNVAAAE